MNEIAEIQQALRTFRDERDWAQFHNPKDLALALSIEASELLETYLWKSAEHADLNNVKEELADVFCYAFLLADQYQFDVKQIVLDKMVKNAAKYPAEQAKAHCRNHRWGGHPINPSPEFP